MSIVRLPLLRLEDVRITSPCPARWESMHGNDLVRFCDGCGKAVYNLSAITREKAELLISAIDGPKCVRFYWRVDGMVQTADCPVGLRGKWHQAFRRGAVFASVLPFLASVLGIAGMFIRTKGVFVQGATAALSGNPSTMMIDSD